MAVKAVGCVKLTVFVVVQALPSVIVQVYVPAVRPVAIDEVPPDGAHEYV